MEEKKSIRFRVNHVLSVRGKELRFKRDDIIPVGESHQISEDLARDFIRRGVAVPGDCHGAAIAFQFKGGTKDD
jgi:hypothetical protein